MSIQKHMRGGVRLGAGRPVGTTRGQGVMRNITFAPDVWASIEQAAKQQAVKPADLVRAAVDAYLKKV